MWAVMLFNTASVVIFTLNFISVTDFLNTAIFIPNGIGISHKYPINFFLCDFPIVVKVYLLFGTQLYPDSYSVLVNISRILFIFYR